MHLYLETDRLILRRFTEDDLENLVALDSDPAVMRYLTGGEPTPREAIERKSLPNILGYYARGDRYGYWAAIERASGDFLGWFHFRPAHDGPDDEPELGYRLRRAAWGKGYGTEGSRALIRRGFAEFGARRVFATTYEHNLGSRRVMEKAGLTLVRRFRATAEQYAAWGTSPDSWDGDEVEYALTREGWERQEGVGTGRG